MNKKTLSLIAATAISFSGLAQTVSNNSSSGSGNGDTFGRTGMSTVNLYYGLSITNSIYRAVAGNNTDVQFSSFGPIGLMYEYFVTDNVGLGIDCNYRKISLSYSYLGFDNNNNNVTYTDSWDFTSIRAMFRANFHFTHSEKFDAYALVSAGYRGNSYVIKSTDPFYSSGKSTFNNVVPFGVKPGIGLRYFFTENLGLNMEFALGTPLLSGGLSCKF